jgi:Eukaryotic mitochondrial regulator protein
MIHRRHCHQPFPRNPTFKPPIPLSDNIRRAIYDSYVANPVANDAHTLSTRYGVSVRRIEAIIRLKQLEAQWEKVRVTSTFLVYRRFLRDEYND